MSNPRFRPRDFISDKIGFGLKSRPFWIKVYDPQQQRQLDAARMQHEWARLIWQALDRRDIELAEYARAAGDTSDRLERVLRGQVIMRLEDVATARRLLQISLD